MILICLLWSITGCSWRGWSSWTFWIQSEYTMINKWHITCNSFSSSRFVRWTRTDGISIYLLPRVTEDSLVSVVPLALLVLLVLVVLLVQLVTMVPRWVSPVLTHFVEVMPHIYCECLGTIQRMSQNTNQSPEEYDFFFLLS